MNSSATTAQECQRLDIQGLGLKVSGLEIAILGLGFRIGHVGPRVEKLRVETAVEYCMLHRPRPKESQKGSPFFSSSCKSAEWRDRRSTVSIGLSSYAFGPLVDNPKLCVSESLQPCLKLQECFSKFYTSTFAYDVHARASQNRQPRNSQVSSY